MEYYKIEMKGRFQLKAETSLPSFNSSYEGRLSYYNDDIYLNDSTTQRKIYHEGNLSSFCGAFAKCTDDNIFTCCNTFQGDTCFTGSENYFCDSRICIRNCSSSSIVGITIGGWCDFNHGMSVYSYGDHSDAIIAHSGCRYGVYTSSTCCYALYACTQCGDTAVYGVTWEGKAACFRKTRAGAYAVYIEASNGASGMCINACNQGIRVFSVDYTSIFGSSENCFSIYGCSGDTYSVVGCADHDGMAGVYGRAASSSTACGVLAASTWRYGVIGCSVNCFGVVGNTDYCNISSKYLKHTREVCLTKCLKDNPLKVYKYYWEDANNRGYNQSIGPLAEDFNKTFKVNNSNDPDEYEGLWTVDGVALGLSIENNSEINKLKNIVIRLYSCIKKLEEK